MAIKEHVDELKKGKASWNRWRRRNPRETPDFSEFNFLSVAGKSAKRRGMIDFRGWNFEKTNFERAFLELTNFTSAKLCGANFTEAILQNSDFVNCDISGSNMRKAVLTGASFRSATIINVNFERAMLTGANFSGATIKNCLVYGCSLWDIHVDDTTIQKDLYIRKMAEVPKGKSKYLAKNSLVTVDNLKTASFMFSLMVDSRDIARNIDEATNRVVLLLGKFRDGGAERLDRIKELLSQYGLIPIKFDFEKPDLLNLIETITIIAGLSKFIIADLSGPSVPAEIERISSSFYKPILLLVKEDEIQNMYAMVHDQLRNENVLFLKYKDEDELHNKILAKITDARKLNVKLKNRGALSARKIDEG